MHLRRGAWSFGLAEVPIRSPALPGCLWLWPFTLSQQTISEEKWLFAAQASGQAVASLLRAAPHRAQHESLGQLCYLRTCRHTAHLRTSVSLHLKQPEKCSENETHADSDLICWVCHTQDPLFLQMGRRRLKMCPVYLLPAFCIW